MREHKGVASIAAVQPLHVAAYIEALSRARSPPTAKQRLAAIRRLVDWLVVGQVMPHNPASSVRRPSHVVKRGKTPVLAPDEARQLLGLMVFSFARIGAALAMKIEDAFTQNRRLWVRLHEKGGKIHEMPCRASPRGRCFGRLAGGPES